MMASFPFHNIFHNINSVPGCALVIPGSNADRYYFFLVGVSAIVVGELNRCSLPSKEVIYKKVISVLSLPLEILRSFT